MLYDLSTVTLETVTLAILLSTLEVSLSCQLFLNLCIWEFYDQLTPKSIHSLMGAGLHGENGLDPDTSFHLLQTYVVPVLVYGLEVVLLNGIHQIR